MSESRQTKLSITVGVAVAIAGCMMASYVALADAPARPMQTPSTLAHLVDVAWAILDRSFQRSPLAVTGLLVGLALPLTGASILAVRRIVRRLGRRRTATAVGELSLEPRSNAGSAWLAVGGPRRREIALAREIHRIGRDEENDVTLTGPAAGTYAIIHRTPEHEFVVIDVGGAGGPGLAVNGNRCTRAALANGDRIAFGPTQVTFHRGRQPGASCMN